jgi:hypothetical protein
VSKLGITAALDDPAMMQNHMNMTGFTNIFGGQAQTEKANNDKQDIRKTLAMNI